MDPQSVDFKSSLGRARAIMHVANRAHDSGHLTQSSSDIVKRPGEIWGRANGKMVSTVNSSVCAEPDLDTQPMQHFFGRQESHLLADQFEQRYSEFVGISQRIHGFIGDNFANLQSGDGPPRSGSVEEGVSEQFEHRVRLADHDSGYETVCPGCGQRFLDNGWTGYTPIYENGYGQRTWTCPTCGQDMKHAQNRPLDGRSAGEFTNPLYRPHYLWHDRGADGRGLVHPNGSVYTWPEGEATHAQRSRVLDIDPFDFKRHFVVNPDNTFSMHMLPGRRLPSNEWVDYISNATQLDHSPLPGQEVLGSWGRGKVVRAKFAEPSGDLSQRLSDFESPYHPSHFDLTQGSYKGTVDGAGNTYVWPVDPKTGAPHHDDVIDDISEWQPGPLVTNEGWLNDFLIEDGRIWPGSGADMPPGVRQRVVYQTGLRFPTQRALREGYGPSWKGWTARSDHASSWPHSGRIARLNRRSELS